MLKKICVLTASRADYGLLKPLIKKINMIDKFDVRIVVTGAHLSPEFGLTYKEIENDGFKIDERIEILLSSDTTTSISKSMGLAMISFADYFGRLEPDLLIILGDRYESLAVSIVAMNQQVPIAHFHGGETTEGVIDESIRHSITKMSYLHFTSTEKYRERVIQLGENPNRVFNVGALGIENIKQEQLMTKEELEVSLEFSLQEPYAIVTYHPVTLDKSSSQDQIKNLLDAIKEISGLRFIFTKGNSDADGRVINEMIDSFVSENSNCKSFVSLGLTRYLSAIKYAEVVIGNSSSGIIEVPSFHIPTINIGDRQRGRLQSKSVINCNTDVESITKAMKLARTNSFKEKITNIINPYEKESTSTTIVEILVNKLLHSDIDIKKKFYDIDILE